MRRLAIVLLLSAIVGIFQATVMVAADQIIQGDQVEQFLRRARFNARQELGTGVTKSYKVTLALDGKTQFAVLKTIDQKRPGPAINALGQVEFDFQDSWRTEVAAYELDKLIDLGMVPATIQRTSPYDSVPASLQLWVEASMSEAKRRQNGVIPKDPVSWSEQLAKMYVFDALIFNTDRHPDNLLITDDFKVRLIDHSRSFRPAGELRNRDDLTRFSRKLMEKVEKLNATVLGKELGDYLSLAQLDGLMKRRQLLLDRVREMVKQYGENAVYYP
jgi:hypothetical protein